MGRWISRKELSFVFYGGPIALIDIKKKNLEPEKIYRIGDYFACEYGIYGIDSETIYRYNKQPLLFYNSHGHYLPKEHVNKFYSLFYKKKFMTLKNELAKFYPSLKTKKFNTIYEVLQHVVDLTDHNSIDLDTEKYLPWYRAYNPVNKKRTNEFGWKGIEAIKSLRPRMKKLLPIATIMVVLIVLMIISQNIPQWIEQGREWLSHGIGG